MSKIDYDEIIRLEKIRRFERMVERDLLEQASMDIGNFSDVEIKPICGSIKLTENKDIFTGVRN